MTDEQYKMLLKEIETCKWKQGFNGVDMCRLGVIPCSEVIDQSNCVICREFFQKIKESEG